MKYFLRLNFWALFNFLISVTALQYLVLISPIKDKLIFNILSVFVSYFITMFVYYKNNKQKIDYNKIIGNFNFINIFIGLFGGLIIFFLEQILAAFMIPNNHTVGENAQVLTSLPIILTILFTVIIAPIVEETFFRGFFAQLQDENTSNFVYYLSTSIIFSIPHIQNLDTPIYAIYNILAVFMSGIILAILYKRSNWIGTNIIAHATSNGIAILLMLMVMK